MLPQWQISGLEQEQPSYTFPDDDLMLTLIDIYFIQSNSFFPLLHRPTFEKSITNGLHRRDHMFGATVLTVCALGSRYSDDPRVFLEGTDSLHSRGWKWFGQVQLIRRSFLERPSLYELQLYSVRHFPISSTVLSSFVHICFSFRCCLHRDPRRLNHPGLTLG